MPSHLLNVLNVLSCSLNHECSSIFWLFAHSDSRKKQLLNIFPHHIFWMNFKNTPIFKKDMYKWNTKFFCVTLMKCFITRTECNELGLKIKIITNKCIKNVFNTTSLHFLIHYMPYCIFKKSIKQCKNIIDSYIYSIYILLNL